MIQNVAIIFSAVTVGIALIGAILATMWAYRAGEEKTREQAERNQADGIAKAKAIDDAPAAKPDETFARD